MDGIYAALNTQARPTGKWITYKANKAGEKAKTREGNYGRAETEIKQK
jgi:hypothetical protein